MKERVSAKGVGDSSWGSLWGPRCQVKSGQDSGQVSSWTRPPAPRRLQRTCPPPLVTGRGAFCTAPEKGWATSHTPPCCPRWGWSGGDGRQSVQLSDRGGALPRRKGCVSRGEEGAAGTPARGSRWAPPVRTETQPRQWHFRECLAWVGGDHFRSRREGALASCSRFNKSPQTGWLKYSRN